jgi:hypothetical protein
MSLHDAAVAVVEGDELLDVVQTRIRMEAWCDCEINAKDDVWDVNNSSPKFNLVLAMLTLPALIGTVINRLFTTRFPGTSYLS